MIIEDNINLMNNNPLFGFKYNSDYDYFLDMGSPYNKDLIKIIHCFGEENNIGLRKGTYAGVIGPVLETKAEIKMLMSLGADAVGMSTIPEVIMANFLNIDVLGISHIRNIISHLRETDNIFKHSEGFKRENIIGKRLAKIIEKILEKI